MHEMKPQRTIAVPLLLVGLAALTFACHLTSVRETPIVSVVRKHASAVVNIRTERIVDLKEDPAWGQYGEQMDMFLKQYFGENYSKGTIRYRSIGSGVILDKSGLIVTNAHVIQKATSIYVVLQDGTLLKAEVLGLSKEDDLAIMKTDLPYLIEGVQMADITNLMIGETVIAIGNPLGLENSVTVGVISGKDRAFSKSDCQYSCSGLLQTDASINPGNSGGALLNLEGKLVGINLAVVQHAQNIGFAVPVNKIRELREQYK
jgi:serine protease Do